jgi:hypothetical protein
MARLSVLKLFPVIAAFVLLLIFLSSCDKNNDDRQPLPPTNVTIDPNSTIYQPLNVVGGWMYLGEQDGVEPPSRGIIVYRLAYEQFLAYERTPPFKPDSCCNPSKTVCTSLIVDNYFPFVMDTCTMSKFLILDGSPVEGPTSLPLGMYITEYYGELLYIHD